MPVSFLPKPQFTVPLRNILHLTFQSDSAFRAAVALVIRHITRARDGVPGMYGTSIYEDLDFGTVVLRRALITDCSYETDAHGEHSMKIEFYSVPKSELLLALSDQEDSDQDVPEGNDLLSLIDVRH